MSALFAFDFMRHAFLAATIVAILSAAVGTFLVLRGQTFAGHALSHVGFAGATGSVLLGASPLAGLLVVTVIASLGMGALGERAQGRDVAIGLVLSLSLGLGLLFLHFYTRFAGQATALLFGNVLGVDTTTLWLLLVLGVASLAALAFIARPLLFASLQPELAEARGVSLRGMGMGFMVIVAVATAECAQIVGILLVFALMVGPPATALRLTPRFGTAMGLAILIGLGQAWGGLILAFYTDWPVSFWITALGAAAYLGAWALPERTGEAATASA